MEQMLVQAERHVTLGEHHIARQRNGHDSTKAKELLAVFLATQVSHVIGRDRLLKELKLS